MSTPNVGYGFVPCSHDDPKRSHVFIDCTKSDCTKSWSVPCYVKCDECAKLPARKPVEIPDGWELVPELELDLIPEDGEWQFITNRGARGELANTSRGTARSWINILDVVAFIRRKPVQPTIEPSKPAVDWSKPLATIGGDAVDFLRTINSHPYNRLCIQRKAGGRETAVVCDDSGNPWSIINTPERIKREVWVNVYESGGITPWADKDTADTHALEGRVACVRVQIDCAIGEGL
jgi:hypothetical protein